MAYSFLGVLKRLGEHEASKKEVLVYAKKK